MTCVTRLATFAITVAALFAAPLALALDKVRTYTQTNYPGFVQFVAKEQGLFTKYGIDPDLRYFPSGAPIVQAAAAKEWDVAFLGAPPAVIGGSSLGITTVGIVYNESGQHKLIGRPDFVAQAAMNPGLVKGRKMFVTTLSTGHFMVEACLRKMNLGANEVTIVPSDQTASVTAFIAGQGDLVQAWPPYTAALLERGNRVLCDGEQAGARIATVWVATKEFAAKSPELLVRWLRANGEAIDWIRKDAAQTTEAYKRFMALGGQTLSDATLKDTIATVMTVEPLKSQIKYFTAPAGDKSFIVDMYENIAQFFVRNGRLKEAPDFSTLVDGRFLRMAVAP
jgi:sulfonate transport system substrate-binding protein